MKNSMKKTHRQTRSLSPHFRMGTHRVENSISTTEDKSKLKAGELIIGNTYKFKLDGVEIIGTLEQRKNKPSDFTSTFLVFTNKDDKETYLTINKSKGIFEEVGQDESMDGIELKPIRKKTDYSSDSSYFSDFKENPPFFHKGGRRKSRSKRHSKRKRRTRSSRFSFF